MKQMIRSIGGACIAVLMLAISCKKERSQVNQGSQKANTIKGTIYDAKGNKYKLDNSTVLVHVHSVGQNNTAYHISMDGDSHYEQKVAAGLYTFEARAWTSLNGKVISVPLDPADGQPASAQFNSANGISRDFQLKLTGLKPGEDANNPESYYGGKISICDGAYVFSPTGYANNLAAKYPGSTVVYILTPKSDHIDGSHASIIEVNVPVENVLIAGRHLVNIPLARYYVSALLKKPTGQQYPLKLTFTTGSTTTHYDFVDISFSPVTSDPECNPGTPHIAVWEN